MTEDRIGYFGKGTQRVMAIVEFFDIDSVNEFCEKHDAIDIAIDHYLAGYPKENHTKFYVKYWRQI